MTVHTLVDKTALQELKKYLLRPKGRKGLQILMGVLALTAVGAVLYGEFATATICLFGVLVFGVEIIALENQQVKLSLKRLRELYGEECAEGELTFQEGTLLVKNLQSDGQVQMECSSVDRVVESEHYYALFTREWQMLVVDKAQFTAQGEEEFLQELCRRLPSAKRIGRTKKRSRRENVNRRP